MREMIQKNGTTDNTNINNRHTQLILQTIIAAIQLPFLRST